MGELRQWLPVSNIALRSLIKSKKKDSAPYIDELYFLYWLASIKSFSVPYSQLLGEPGFNVLSRISGCEILDLCISYYEIGYEYLDLLNKSDVKLLIENFGEPQNNNVLYNIHYDLWHRYEIKLKAEKDIDLRDFFSSL